MCFLILGGKTFLQLDDRWNLVALRVVASQTFPGILSWGAWVTVPVCSCQIIVLLDNFHVTDYKKKKGEWKQTLTK